MHERVSLYQSMLPVHEITSHLTSISRPTRPSTCPPPTCSGACRLVLRKRFRGSTMLDQGRPGAARWSRVGRELSVSQESPQSTAAASVHCRSAFSVVTDRREARKSIRLATALTTQQAHARFTANGYNSTPKTPDRRTYMGAHVLALSNSRSSMRWSMARSSGIHSTCSALTEAHSVV